MSPMHFGVLWSAAEGIRWRPACKPSHTVSGPRQTRTSTVLEQVTCARCKRTRVYKDAHERGIWPHTVKR